jgi:small subunit ribosomal protein S1
LTTNPQTQQVDSGELITDMATLLEGGLDYRTPQRGEIIPGVVMGWDRDGMLVDIGAKSEGLVPRNEMQSMGTDPDKRLESGEKVLVFVMQPDSSDGQITLSLDRARGEHGWLTLQERFDSGEVFEAQVTGYNKGGLLMNVEGVNAFVPLSQLVGIRPDRGREEAGGNALGEAVGRTLRIKVIEINRRRNRAILSERAALQEWRAEQKERLIQELREGDIRRGRITSVRSFGVFVDLGGADGLAHLSELSWDRDKSPTDLFHVGDEVDVYITKIDPENKKIALSLRRAKPEQWDAIVDKYREGQVVTGLITKLVTFGAFARIEGPVEGLVHVSELVDRRIGHPREVVREGDLLPLKVVRIERDRHRLGLSLRRAREEGEAMGYVFTEGGEVLSVPEEIRAEFEEREGPIPAPSADEPVAERREDFAEGESPATPPAETYPEAEAAPALDAGAIAQAEAAPTLEAETIAQAQAAPALEAEAIAEDLSKDEAEAAVEEEETPEAVSPAIEEEARAPDANVPADLSAELETASVASDSGARTEEAVVPQEVDGIKAG